MALPYVEGTPWTGRLFAQNYSRINTALVSGFLAPQPQEFAVCSEYLPSQITDMRLAYSTERILADVFCFLSGNSGVRLLTYAQAGWLIQQIGTTCQWNGQVAGGFAECWESDHFVRIQAFRS